MGLAGVVSGRCLRGMPTLARTLTLSLRPAGMPTPNIEVASMKYTARSVAQQVSVGSEAVSPPERSACAWDRMYRCLSRPSC